MSRASYGAGPGELRASRADHHTVLSSENSTESQWFVGTGDQDTVDVGGPFSPEQMLIDERTRFTLEVAHNLRAPLAAGLGMLATLWDTSTLIAQVPAGVQQFVHYHGELEGEVEPDVAAADAPVQVGFQRRFDPAYVEARARLAARLEQPARGSTERASRSGRSAQSVREAAG